jgi:hypothetical protein
VRTEGCVGKTGAVGDNGPRMTSLFIPVTPQWT